MLAWAKRGAPEQKDLENTGTTFGEVGISVTARIGERFGEVAFAESISALSQAPGRSRLGSCLHFLICQMQIRVPASQVQ